LELCAYEPEQLLDLVSREAIVRTIPFLIELLDAEIIQEKELLLLLLDELVGYKSGEICLDSTQKEKYRSYVQRIHDTVNEGRKLYTKLAQSDQLAVQEGAKELIESLANLSLE
jgi:hypothetical protein